MIRAFMIEFEYDGKKEFANVVEYKHSPSVFYFSTVAQEHRPIRKLILREKNNTIEPTEHSPVAEPGFVEAVTNELKEYLRANPPSS